MSDWIVETLLDAPTEVVETLDPTYSIEVVLGDAALVGELPTEMSIEVFPDIPDTNAYIESYEFSKTGVLSVQAGTSELPVAGGTFVVIGLAARISTPPTGSSIILDIKKNGVSIFSVGANRPTILAGTKIAVVGSWSNVTLTDGDYLTVDVVQVGSITPGSNLVVPVRLCKIA